MNQRKNLWAALVDLMANFRDDPPITKLIALAFICALPLGVYWTFREGALAVSTFLLARVG